MEKIILTQLTETELRQIIRDELKTILVHIDKRIELARISTAEDMVSRKDAAKFLLTSLVTIDKWTRQGKIQGFRIGGRVVYRKKDISEAMEKMKIPIRV